MTKLLLIIFFLIVFLVILLLSFFYLNRKKKAAIKTIIRPSSLPLIKEREFNPDISTDDWDLHKLRLERFRRSQYKGLTFFYSSENRIYYLSEEGKKVYC